MPPTLRKALLASSLLAMTSCSGAPATQEPEGTANDHAAAAPATEASPVSVVERHVSAMKSGDIDAIMSDYAKDTVVITPQGLVSDQSPATGPGVYSGIDNAKKVFATLTAAGNLPAVKGMETRVEPKGYDIAFLYWTQLKGTPKEISGRDVFVVRDSKIVFQDIIPDSK